MRLWRPPPARCLARALVVNEFGLVEPDLRLREGVVVSVADGTDRGIDALVDEPVGEGD